jgi:F-type H+-transporting ATPase subunit gamma
MRGTRNIKRRIRGIENTQQITRAMHMVAAAKLRKIQVGAETLRPYIAELETVMNHILSQVRGYKSPYLDERDKGGTGYLVITADRGLCGGYNGNVVRECVEHMRTKGAVAASNTSDALGASGAPGLVIVGRRGRDYFQRRNYDIKAEFLHISDMPEYRQAKDIAHTVLELFNAGMFREVYMVSTEFISILSRRPVVTRLLPFQPQITDRIVKDKDVKPQPQYIYEPSAGSVLDFVFPKYLEMQVYHGLLESKASEFSARMMAMDSATDNADEMIENLTLLYNRARQAQITQEISEIVGGAEALW